MPKIKAADGTELYYEEAGSGVPIVFVHEFAGDYRTWEPQMRHFARTYRCVTYSQRGYPPSDVPSDPARYGQDIARSDVIALMDALGVLQAHVVGHSMGAYTALHVGLHHAARCISVTGPAAAGARCPMQPSAMPCAKSRSRRRKCSPKNPWPKATQSTATRRCGRPISTRTRAVSPSSCTCCRSIRHKVTR